MVPRWFPVVSVAPGNQGKNLKLRMLAVSSDVGAASKSAGR